MKGFKEFLKEGIVKVDANDILDKIENLKNKILDKGLSSLDIIEILNNILNEFFIQIEFDNEGRESKTGIIESSIDKEEI